MTEGGVGCRDWNITKEGGGRRGRGQADHVTVKSLQAAVCAGKGRQRHPPILTLPFHHNNSSGKWPPSVL